jgi:hypothetical protein
MKLPERLDRPTFWMWVVPLLLGHLLLAMVLLAGAKGIGTIDTLIILWLAMIVAARFHDIGWPRWIAPTFMLVSMLLLPLVAAGYAIASNAAPARLPDWMNLIGWITGPANLVLLVVAGSVPGTPQIDPPGESLQVSGEAISPPVAESQFHARDALVVAGGVAVIVVILGAAFSGIFTSHRQQVSSQPSIVLPQPPPAPSRAEQQMRVESNGLTKYTNDFLRQLPQSPANRR